MSEEPKSKRTRSPAYPAIDLEEAIAKAATLWQKINRHSASVDTVGGLWGYDKNSSAGGSVVSAMLKYGLLVDQGEKDKREVKLTEDAIRLTYNPDSASSEHQQDLKRAALLPKIHAELWKKYGGVIPDDSVVKRYLVVDRKFNEQYVDGFIKQFKKTIKFANLSPGDKVPVNEVEDEQPSLTSSMTDTKNEDSPPPREFAVRGPGDSLTESMANMNRQNPALVKPAELAVPMGEWVARVPYPVSEEDFELFLDTLRLWKRKMTKPPESFSQTNALILNEENLILRVLNGLKGLGKKEDQISQETGISQVKVSEVLGRRPEMFSRGADLLWRKMK